MMAFLVGEGPVVKGPLLQPSTSAVVGLVKTSLPITNSPFMLTWPERMPGLACVFTRIFRVE